MLTYCNRPRNFEQLIFKHLKSTITKNDLLIHLGDFCIGKDEYWHEKFKEIEGIKWLVKGNHDHKSNYWYLTHGWNWVGKQFTDTYFGKKICFSHVPQYEEMHNKEYNYDLNIHGHFHNSMHRSEEIEMKVRKNTKQCLLSIENNNYMPITLEHFIQKNT
jgi:calcineurin-like phosphoesterase family protein